MTIDIMMPFWGDVVLLERAVESVLAQTDPDWRLVVIDDRYPGTEHTRYLAQINDPRVEVVVNERNLGVAGNFQRCVQLARAPHTTIMGCDDLLLPSYVARLDQLITDYPDAAYFQPGVQVIDQHGDPSSGIVDRVKEWYRPPGTGARALRGEALALSLLRGNWTYFPSICWRTDVLKHHGFRPDYEVVLDLALQIDIAISGGLLIVDDVDEFQYRRHTSSVSTVAAVDGRRFEEERRFFFEATERCEEHGWNRAGRAARHHVSSRLSAASRIPSAVRAGDRHGVGELVRHALSPYPRDRPGAR